MNYVRKIDAIRAIAVLMVIVSHWVPKTSKLIPFGEIGVDIFFVISGFLITSILLMERAKAAVEGKKNILVLRNFISRRALRIFPIYYFSLILFCLQQDYEAYHIRENIIFYLTYTTNILFFLQNAWDGYLSPLWSLAVEEQFYLVWPLLMIFAPEKHLLKIIVISILTGLVFPFFFDVEMAKVLTPSCMSALGMGALLAWLTIKRLDEIRRYRNLISSIAVILIVLMVIIVTKVDFIHSSVLIRIVSSGLSFVLIMYCIGIYEPVKWIEWIMNNSQLIFIGQISYGLYLYHNLISVASRSFIEKYFNLIFNGLSPTYINAMWLAMKFILLIFFSWLSYKFIERPFLSLKRYFVLD